MADDVNGILEENARRLEKANATFNPITGEGSTGERTMAVIPDFPVPVQWLPKAMTRTPLLGQLLRSGSVDRMLERLGSRPEDYGIDREKLIEAFVRLRLKHDFPFWAASLAYIKNKGGGQDVLFRLNRPQRLLLERLEDMRLNGTPIRIVLLKARQWGGSTLIQLYMAWLQLVHENGLNSLIIAHQGTASDEIKDMFDRMLTQYPVRLLHELGEAYKDNEPKIVGVGKSGNIHRIPQRNCKIKIGTAERPDSCRGGDYSLVHLSEVAYWKKTEGKTPEDIVRSATSGVLFAPDTMIVYESTANGTGNFFHREYEDAKARRSQFAAVFVAWYEIDLYAMPLNDTEAFAASLYENRDNATVRSTREESGKYLWWLWERGATLEAINWYIGERAKYTDHGLMAAEFPSDDIEAFVHSGARVFDRYRVERLRPSCRPPRMTGDVYADADTGEKALRNVRFSEDVQGLLDIWEPPEVDRDEKVTERYLAVVDIGGRSASADFSVILVIDRLNMLDGGKPSVVAQWYGHIDMDILAWKAAQVAAYYDNALLVIESNTLETHDRERQVDGDQSQFILNQIRDFYPNLYARRQSEEEIRERVPRKYGFHTNVATKPMVISTLQRTVRENLYTERDERCLDELLCYERKPNGAFGAIPGKHDDLLMTRAIGLHVCFSEMGVPCVVPRRAAHGGTQGNKVISAATI